MKQNGNAVQGKGTPRQRFPVFYSLKSSLTVRRRFFTMKIKNKRIEGPLS
ncbi:hypothetical protein HOLDEFILI_01038 [Holdemania filiformis DSM 12042]|uniref:Uncharacterized protein n=1 Tax=Holdemania filiformis DSM 12042 TaxID=545696 RepID=B9Y5F6_9FIRM|nr:hypothetical protein HOLDEFILI_01038 [Holdemania filiformis DSM 12042]